MSDQQDFPEHPDEHSEVEHTTPRPKPATPSPCPANNCRTRSM